MTNSVRQLTAALTRFLNDDLLPTVAEPYLRGQLFAAINILENLGVSARWDHEPSPAQVNEEASLAASMAAFMAGPSGRPGELHDADGLGLPASRANKPGRDRAVAELAMILAKRRDAAPEMRELKRLVLLYLDLDLRAARSRTARPAMAKLAGTADDQE